MRYSHRLPILLLLGSSLFLSACDKLPGSSSPTDKPARAAGTHAVAVLDLAAVAKALGRDEVLKQQVQAAGQQLRQQLSEFSTGLQTKLREEQAKLGSTPTDDERKQLQQQLLQAQRQVQQSQVLARQKATQFQNQLAMQFRDEIRPVAAQIARDLGASTVAPANTLLWFDSSVDITGAVIDAMRAKGAATGAPVLVPAPAQQDQPKTQ